MHFLDLLTFSDSDDSDGDDVPLLAASKHAKVAVTEDETAPTGRRSRMAPQYMEKQHSEEDEESDWSEEEHHHEHHHDHYDPITNTTTTITTTTTTTTGTKRKRPCA